MSEERCDLTELIKSQCAHCRGVGYNREYTITSGPETWPVEPDEDVYFGDMRAGAYARFPGVCPVCGDKITVGEMIEKATDSTWKHRTCRPEEPIT